MKVALVTGAGRGLGRAIAGRLAVDGYEVVAVDIDAEAAAGAAAALGGRSYPCDVADRSAVTALAEQVGPVHVLVNNAGIWTYGSVIDAADADVDRVLAVNLGGTLNCCRAFAPGMVAAGGGVIVNLSSLAAAMAAPVVEVYPVSKGAVETLTRQLALDLGPKGIRVNAVGPGSMLTEGTAPAYEGERMAQRAALVPLRRIGTPEDIANAVGFLVSDQASYISGQILYVDGGASAAGR
ncbi:MAG TPA: SDR family oxidoreductase [Acidimicrobiales bacterium]|nr:SDR family oxidoreductase [Acidimicrobiales bacterium]